MRFIRLFWLRLICKRGNENVHHGLKEVPNADGSWHFERFFRDRDGREVLLDDNDFIDVRKKIVYDQFGKRK